MMEPRVEHVKNVNRQSPHVLYIGRGSKWGNPYKLGRDGDRKEVIEKYQSYLLDSPHLLRSIKRGELDGMTLACYCKPRACHGDVLRKAWEYMKGSDEE